MSSKVDPEIERKPKKHTLDSDEEESDAEYEEQNRLKDDDFEGEEVSLFFKISRFW